VCGDSSAWRAEWLLLTLAREEEEVLDQGVSGSARERESPAKTDVGVLRKAVKPCRMEASADLLLLRPVVSADEPLAAVRVLPCVVPYVVVLCVVPCVVLCVTLCVVVPGVSTLCGGLLVPQLWGVRRIFEYRAASALPLDGAHVVVADAILVMISVLLCPVWLLACAATEHDAPRPPHAVDASAQRDECGGENGASVLSGAGVGVRSIGSAGGVDDAGEGICCVCVRTSWAQRW